MNEKTIKQEQNTSDLNFMNNALRVQVEVLQQSCADYRKEISQMMTEIETLKTTNAVLKCTVQRLSGV